MKIRSVEVFAFKYDHHYRLGGHTDAPNRLPGTDYYFEPQWQQAYSRFTESCLVKIITDEGVIGWGEAQAPLVPEVAATLIAKLFAPAILGMDALDAEAVYNRLYHLNHVRGHVASYTIDAITAIDIALWDIKGKVLGKPVNQLLGGVINKTLPLYVSGLRRSNLSERQELAKEKIKEGYRGVKLFIGDTAEKTIQECAAIREVIGNDAELAFDAICRHEYQAAYQIGLGLDELDAAWFEAPLDPEDVNGHAKLAQAIKTPVAIGEPLRTVNEFKPWVECQAMKIAQPDIVRCGITGGLRIIDYVQHNNLKVAPHIGVCTAVGVVATWHIASVIKGVLTQEHQLGMFETANMVLNEPLKVINGEAILPTGTGLCVSVDEEFIIKHSPEKWRIDMQNNKHFFNTNQ